jgi:hypothetical protein
MMRSLIRYGAAAAGSLARERLRPRRPDPNNPRPLACSRTASDLENFLGGYYKRWHARMYNTTTNIGACCRSGARELLEPRERVHEPARGDPARANDNSIGTGCEAEPQGRLQPHLQEVTRSRVERAG